MVICFEYYNEKSVKIIKIGNTKREMDNFEQNQIKTC